MRSANPFPMERAPASAPDRWRLTRPVRFVWRRPPAWVLRSLPAHASLSWGRLRVSGGTVTLRLRRGWCFDVSAVPSFRRAMPAAAVHDWIYGHAEILAALAGVSVRLILHVADRWFLAQMSASGFLLARTYFIGVRIFGYWFWRLFSRHD